MNTPVRLRHFPTLAGKPKSSTLRLPSKFYFRNYRVFGSSSENNINDSRSAIVFGKFLSTAVWAVVGGRWIRKKQRGNRCFPFRPTDFPTENPSLDGFPEGFRKPCSQAGSFRCGKAGFPWGWYQLRVFKAKQRESGDGTLSWGEKGANNFEPDPTVLK